MIFIIFIVIAICEIYLADLVVCYNSGKKSAQ